MVANVLVTVVCITYNHEKYLRDALDGFLSQKTDFQYKIVIYDDASTDNTAAIIEEYALKYPQIIVPIYQKENQYQKGTNMFKEFVAPLLEGKYYAYCEGDDYWCDPHKLQEQVDFMRTHPDYSACVHNTVRLDCRSGKQKLLYGQKAKDIEVKDVVRKGGRAFHISSLLAKTEYFVIPDELTAKGLGDYPKTIYLAINGKIRFINKAMSVYRYYADGSWTSRNFGDGDVSKAIALDNGKIMMLESFDHYFNGRYHGLFSDAIELKKVEILYKQKKYIEIMKSKRSVKLFYSQYGTLRTLLLVARAIRSTVARS